MKYKSILAIAAALVLSMSMLAGCGTGDTKHTETAGITEETDSDAGGTSDAESSENVEAASPESDSSDTDVSEADDLFQSEDTDGTEDAVEEEVSAAVNQVSTEEPLTGKHHAQIVIKDYGTIEVELDADTAPISVTNFVKLAEEDFYDGLTFHRIIDGFMMQGGDPNGNGTGGSEETIKGEFESNGVKNDISHKRGVISMARSQAMDSASSQFFIVQTDATYLDGQYAAFGTVTEGMDIVDEICKEAVPVDSNGLIDTDKQPVIETIDIID